MKNAKPPWHERIKPLGWIRRPLRAALFTLLRKASDTDDGKVIAANMLAGLLPSKPPAYLEHAAAFLPAPFGDLGKPSWPSKSSRRDDAIFITGRFRSGSTLLWNIFRNLKGVTAYYEPLNERRWFDPATRGDRLDPSHRNVSDYWKEYDGLAELGNFYQESWIGRNLFMDPSFWEPNLKSYVELLIDKARGRPVLQFNRIDLRLPWFRRHFPSARIVHLYRHPRDQWCSSLMDIRSFPKGGTKADFARCDQFYLRLWARDLKYHFPFLDEDAVAHPYPLFYYVWKLSYLFGRKYADYSLAFEELVRDPDNELRRLFEVLDISGYDLEQLKRLIVQPVIGRWKDYADHDWFRRHESECETVLADFLGHAPASAAREVTGRTPPSPLRDRAITHSLARAMELTRPGEVAL